MANNEDIPLNLNLKIFGSIEEEFGIEAPIYGCDYKIYKSWHEDDPGFDYEYHAYLLSNDSHFYSFILNKTGLQMNKLEFKETSNLIDQNYGKYSAKDISGIVRTHVPYFVLDNTLIKVDDMENLSVAQVFQTNWFLTQLSEFYFNFIRTLVFGKSLIAIISPIICQSYTIIYCLRPLQV